MKLYTIKFKYAMHPYNYVKSFMAASEEKAQAMFYEVMKFSNVNIISIYA